MFDQPEERSFSPQTRVLLIVGQYQHGVGVLGESHRCEPSLDVVNVVYAAVELRLAACRHHTGEVDLREAEAASVC